MFRLFPMKANQGFPDGPFEALHRPGGLEGRIGLKVIRPIQPTATVSEQVNHQVPVGQPSENIDGGVE